MSMQRFTTNYTTLPESSLVKRSRQGDADAFAELYRHHLPPIYRFIYRRLGGDASAAEDLTSQVFLEALNGLAGYRERGRFVAWLFTITRRRLIDAYRKADVGSLEDCPEPLLGTPDGLKSREDLSHLKQLLDSLDDQTRELLELRFSAGLSFADMAAVLGRSEGAVKMSLYRALDGLRQKWETDDE